MNVAPATHDPARRWSMSRRRRRSASSAGAILSSAWRVSPASSSSSIAPPSAVQLVVRGEVAALPLAGIIDIAAERTRLEKELAKVAQRCRARRDEARQRRLRRACARGDHRGRAREDGGGRSQASENQRGAGAAEERDVSFSDWDDRLTRWLVNPPYRDAAGRKGIVAPFAHAQPHLVRELKFTIPGWPQLRAAVAGCVPGRFPHRLAHR